MLIVVGVPLTNRATGDVGITANADKTTDVQRSSTMTFAAGRPVYVLINPDGVPSVMQAGSMQVDPNESIQILDTLGSVLQLPGGRQYQVITLTEELTIQAVNGTAQVTGDDQGSSYDTCFQSACSYNPLTGQ